jgi:YidC/Oxa1 family membrane protein insertase
VVRSGRLYWGGLEDQYFAALIVPREPGGQARVWTVDVQPVGEVVPTGKEAEAKEPPRQPAVAVSVPPEGVFVFVGPKNYNLLRGLGHDLGSAVWFSSISLFAWMAQVLYQVLIWLHTHVVANYGLAIILATLLLRILLFPLNQFSMVRMKKVQTEMQRIQPKVNAIKNKYRKKKDAEGRAEMNKELMALYKREGINPMGGMSGCLPLVIQFPILIGFYDMLLAAVELRGAPFYGWIRDLTLKDPYYVTPILMGVTMFLQQRMSMTKMGDPAQQRIMMMTPVIFTVMFLNLPSGLVLYWFVNNLLGIGQQWLVNRHIGRLESASQRA